MTTTAFDLDGVPGSQTSASVTVGATGKAKVEFGFMSPLADVFVTVENGADVFQIELPNDPVWEGVGLPVGAKVSISAVGGKCSGAIEVSDGSAGNPAKAPQFKVAPFITYKRALQVGTILKGDKGWIVNGQAVQHEWLRDGVPIAGATEEEYLLGVADVGKMIAYKPHAAGIGGQATATSTAVGPIAMAVLPEPTMIMTANASVAEGNTGLKSVFTTITVDRDGAEGNLTVNLTYGGTATVGSDYSTPPAQVIILAGQNSATFVTNLIGDTTEETDETLIMNAQLAAYPTVLASRTLTITNDDVLVAASPTISMGSNTSITEGDSGTKTVTTTVSVNRDGVTGPLTVNLAYSGTATPGVDYATAPSTVTIPNGQSSAQFSVNINGDLNNEPNETIIVTGALVGYPAATATRTITISNDDVAGAITAEIWIGLGDSTWDVQNGGGSEREVLVDTAWPGVYQVKTDGSISAETRGLSTFSGNRSTDWFSNQEYFGKERRALHPDRKIYIVNCALLGSSISNAGNEWKVGDNNHEATVTRGNLAIRNILTAEPGAKFMGFCERLGSNNYETALEPVFSLMKAHALDLLNRITMNGQPGGTPSSGLVKYVFITPTITTLRNPTRHGYWRQEAMRRLSLEVPGGLFFRPPIDELGTVEMADLHDKTAGVRIMGTRVAQAIDESTAPTFTFANMTIGANDPFIFELIAGPGHGLSDDDDTVNWFATGANAADFEFIRPRRSEFAGSTESARVRHFIQWNGGVVHGVGSKTINLNCKGEGGNVTSKPWTLTIGPATLTAPIDEANGSGAADIGVTCAQSSGTIYWAIYPAEQAAPADGATIQAGTGATAYGSIAVTSAGAKTAAPTGLAPDVDYKTYFAHKRPDGHWSAVVVTDGFSTTSDASTWLAYHDPSGKANIAKAWGNLGTTTGDGSSGGGLPILGTGGYTSGKMRLGGASIPPTWSDFLINVGTPNIKIRQTVKVGPTWPGFIFAAMGHNGKTAATGGDDQSQVTYGIRMGTDGTCRLADPAGDVSFGNFPALTVGNTYTLGIDVDFANNQATFLVDGVVVVGPVSPPGRTIPNSNYCGAGGMYYDTGFEFGVLTVEAND